MKISKIKIDALYGVQHLELTGKPVELRGGTGAGKTSVLDAIKLALTNKSDRSYVIKQGEQEGQIFIQTDNGVEINRKKRVQGSDFNKITQHGTEVAKPQSFLNDIFTPLQLNPIEFAGWDEKQQNREVLNTITFEWTLDWLKEQFGELPRGINYDQHILQVLQDIQAKNSPYWQEREECNRNELYKRQAIAEMAQKLPNGYDVDKWSAYDLKAKITDLSLFDKSNDEIRRAKGFLDAQANKMRGLEANKEIALSALKDETQAEKNGLEKTIERLKAEIQMAEQKIAGLDAGVADKKALIQAEFETAVAKLDADMGTAKEYAGRETVDTTELRAEVELATEMKEFVSEYRTMQKMEQEREEYEERSKYLTGQIEKARKLPGEVLANCELPIKDLTVVDGKPLVRGLPINNLSDGERIELCVDITLAQTQNLEMILLNGVEQLDDASRERLYNKCRDKGLQIIAARTTNDSELTIVEL